MNHLPSVCQVFVNRTVLGLMDASQVDAGRGHRQDGGRGGEEEEDGEGDEEGDPEDEEGPQEDDAQVDPGHHPRVKFPVRVLPLMTSSKISSFFLTNVAYYVCF